MWTIALLSPEKFTYSTTFIQAHKELLNAQVKFLYGKYFPTHTQDDTLLVDSSLKNIARQMFYTRLRGKDAGYLRRMALYQYLKKHHVQAVLAEFGPTGAEVYSICKTANVPLLVHFHGFDAWTTAALRQYGSRYRQMFSSAAYIIAVSREMETQLIKLGAPAEKVVYNCYGPRETFFQLNPKFSSPHFLAVGRFVEKKAPYLTLAAFREVLNQVPEARLIMVGDGPLLNTCHVLAEVWQMNHAVTFTGASTHNHLPDLFESATCFVQHSIVAADSNDQEGTPVAVLEASAAGLPVIATRHAGIKDVVIHGETGYLVAEKDVAGMARHMLQVAQDAQLAKTLGGSGRAFIRTHFSMQRHIDTLNELIEKSIKAVV